MSAFVATLPHAVTARWLAERLSAATVAGDDAQPLHAIAGLDAAEAGMLAFCDAPDPRARLAATRASVVIVSASDITPRAGQALLVVPDVRAAFIAAVDVLLPGAGLPTDPGPGVHPHARIGADTRISPLAAIGANVHIGPRTRVGPGAVIYDDTHVGADCVIGPGATIGWAGLAYHDRADGRRLFFPHLAGVRIGDGVDIGANSCVCRGMLSHTQIRDQAKIGSLAYVSHGVIVGERAWLSAGTAIAGHAAIGAQSLVGIGSVVSDNVSLEEGTLVGGGSAVTRHAAAGRKLFGVPARHIPGMRRFGPTPRG